MSKAEHLTSEPSGEFKERIGGSSWWMLAVLVLFYVLSLIDRGAISLLVVPIQKDLGLTDIQMGLILGPAFAISYSIFGFPMGWASDRVDRRVIIFIAVVIWSVAAAGTGFAWSFASLLIGRVLVGLGEAALSPIAYTMIADEFPPRRMTTALSIYQAGAKLGGAASFTVVALATALAAQIAFFHLPVVGRLEPWQLTLIITGAPGLILALLVFTFREPPRRTHVVRHEPVAGFVPYLQQEAKVFAPMLIAMMAVSIGVLSLGAWVPALLERTYGLKPAQYGPVLSVIHLVGAGLLLAKGMVVDWLRARGIVDAHLRFFSWILIVSIPLTLTAFLAGGPIWLFWLTYGGIEVLAGQFLIYFAATVQLFSPVALRGRIMALFQATFTMIGMGVGPLLVAVMTEKVFADPQMLGTSLGVVVGGSFTIAMIAARLALPQIRRVLSQEDDRSLSVPQKPAVSS